MSERRALLHAAILDGSENMELQEDMVLLIHDGRIEAVGKDLPVPSGYRTEDLTGCFVMPGLIDLRVHLCGTDILPPAAAALQSTGKQRKRFPIPRRFGKARKTEKPEQTEQPTDADAAKPARKAGRTKLSRRSSYSRCLSSARKTLMSGVMTVCTPGEPGKVELSLADKTIRGRAVGPRILTRDIPMVSDEGFICSFSSFIPYAYWDLSDSGATEELRSESRGMLDRVVEGAQKALEEKRPIGIGSNAGRMFVSHYDIWRELEYFRRYIGVSRRFALHTATLANARILGIDGETGSIEPGKAADLLVLREDPLEDLRALATPHLVIFGGRTFRRPSVRKNAVSEQLLDQSMDRYW